MKHPKGCERNEHKQMKNYLLTIACIQKLKQVSVHDIMSVLEHLHQCISGFKVKENSFETSGRYGQLHFHCVCEVPKGFRYKKFTKWGDLDCTNVTFSINWKTVYDYRKAVLYVLKDLSKTNVYRNYYFDQDTQEFSRIPYNV